MARVKRNSLPNRQPPRPATGAQRNAKYRAQGRQIAVVLRDERAIASLDRLAEKHGGVTAAVSHALVSASPSAKSIRTVFSA